jgi:hypothetical protein
MTGERRSDPRRPPRRRNQLPESLRVSPLVALGHSGRLSAGRSAVRRGLRVPYQAFPGLTRGSDPPLSGQMHDA